MGGLGLSTTIAALVVVREVCSPLVPPLVEAVEAFLATVRILIQHSLMVHMVRQSHVDMA